MHSDTDIAAIAAKLTEAQRRQVLNGTVSEPFTPATLRSLIRKRLMHVVPDSPNGRWGLMVNTDLGQRVRAYLESQSHD